MHHRVKETTRTWEGNTEIPFSKFLFVPEQLLLKRIDLTFFWCWLHSAHEAGLLPEATSSLPEQWWEQLCSSRSTLPKTTSVSSCVDISNHLFLQSRYYSSKTF